MTGFQRNLLLLIGAHLSLVLSGSIYARSLVSQLPAYPEKTQIAIVMVTPEATSYIGFVRKGNEWVGVDNRDSVFEIGSITKAFTGTLLAMLANSATVRLDDPISSCVPFALHDYPPDGVEITLAQLANHTSGLPESPPWLLLKARLLGRGKAPYEDYDTTDLWEYLRDDLAVESRPGTTYRYSTFGVGVLGYLLSAKTGVPLETLFADSIFGSRGMRHTSLSTDKVHPYLVRGLEADGEIAPNWDMGALAGAGAIKSCVADLARFASAELSDTSAAFALATRPTFRVEPDIEVGLGWNIYHLGADTVWYGHDGGTRGYGSALRIDVGHRRAVVVLSNVSYFHPETNEIQNLAIALMRQAKWTDALSE